MTPNASRMAIALVAYSLSLALIGCHDLNRPTVAVRDQLNQPAAPSPSAGPPSAPGATSRPVSSRPIASVNDQPIDRAEFIGQLIEARGLMFLQQTLLLSAARQQTAKLNLTVSETDVDREYELTLQADRFNGKDPDPLTPDRKQQLIEDWSRSRGISPTELHIAMQRQAHLRKIAEGRMKITDDMIAKEYDRVHGEKVEIRHIQIAAPRFWKEIKERLDRGERFEDLVMKFSQNVISREKLGLLPPFTRNDPSVPAIFTEVCFNLKPGDYSSLLEAEGSYHVLKLEQRIPPTNAPLDDAEKIHLKRILSARLAAQDMEQLGRSLILSARINIEDRTLRKQYDDAQKSGQITGPPIGP